MDNFIIRNRFNNEEHKFEVSDAANFVMVTECADSASYFKEIYIMATPERKKQYIYKYLISMKDTLYHETV